MKNAPFLHRLRAFMPVFARYWVGTLFLIYAAPKLMAAQFRVLDSVYDTPLSQVSDFWLAWSFFGRSPEYQIILGSAELTIGLLLIFPRTKTLGAICSLPITINILMVDYFFSVTTGALIVAATLLIGALYLLMPEVRRLKALFWDDQRGSSSLRTLSIRLAYAVVVVGIMAGLVAYEHELFPANYGGAFTIERYSINGVEQALSAGQFGRSPMLYFEIRHHLEINFNGRNTDGQYTVDTTKQEFAWTLNSDGADRTLKGTYQVNGDEMTLIGNNGADEIEFDLKRSDGESL